MENVSKVEMFSRVKYACEYCGIETLTEAHRMAEDYYEYQGVEALDQKIG